MGTEFRVGQTVNVDGCKEHGYVVTALQFRKIDGRTGLSMVEISWFSNEAKTAWVEPYRLETAS